MAVRVRPRGPIENCIALCYNDAMELKLFKDIDEETFLKAVSESYNKSEVGRALGIPYSNGSTVREITFLIDLHGANTSHFQKYKHNTDRRKYQLVVKECPVCGNDFEVAKGDPREKTTCSHSCANTYFRTGEDHPNWKGINDQVKSDTDEQDVTSSYGYRKVCFHHHEKRCIICGEENIVAVHHYDENRENGSPENLIPLCPTHHQYVHSRYKHLIIEDIDKYREQFITEHFGV